MKLYSDTHIPKQVAIQLRQHEIDIIRCEEVGMSTASDEEHWQYAQDQKRIILTHDDDFLTLASQAWLNDEQFSGVIYGSPQTQGRIGLIVKTCLANRNKDLTNQVIYISLN